MELVGKDLGFYQRKLKKFSIKTILNIFYQLIDIIEYVHSQGVVHRDFKPENMAVGLGNQACIVYLIDYGLSKIFKINN